MKKTASYALMALLVICGVQNLKAQKKTFSVKSFDKVIVSPHIQATLVEGFEESVTVDYSNVPEGDLHMEVDGNTLWVYLEGAKIITGSEKERGNGYTRNRSYYTGNQAKVTITYKELETLSVRGEEKITCESLLDQKDFTLRIYGESQVYLAQVELNKLKATIYGTSYLEVQKGKIGYQKFTAYGESRVNSIAIENFDTKILAYGESDFRVNVTDRLKVTCYGETHITYEGSPEVERGIVIGEATIRKIG
ncbi:MAG: head GIN domain-containing protein [Bacteroidota bacterium]